MTRQLVQLLKEQLQHHSMVTTTSTVLPSTSDNVTDVVSGLSPTTLPDKHDSVDDLNIGMDPTFSSDMEQLATASLGRTAGSSRGGTRPPVLHTTSLPSHYDRGASLSDMAASSSLASVLMDRMSSLENRVAEQQRQSEAAMTRLLNQVVRNLVMKIHLVKAKIHYTSFPVASPQQVGNINNKSVTSWRGQKSVVSVVSCHFPNSITITFCHLVADLLAKSLTSQ